MPISIESPSGTRRQLAAMQPGLLARFADMCFRGKWPTESTIMRMAYPQFQARALVLQIDSPRNPVFEPWINCPVQRDFLDAICAGRDPLIPHLPHILLFLPERWLNPVEALALMDNLHKYAERRPGALTHVELITQHAGILSDFAADAVGVYTQKFPL